MLESEFHWPLTVSCCNALWSWRVCWISSWSQWFGYKEQWFNFCIANDLLLNIAAAFGFYCFSLRSCALEGLGAKGGLGPGRRWHFRALFPWRCGAAAGRGRSGHGSGRAAGSGNAQRRPRCEGRPRHPRRRGPATPGTALSHRHGPAALPGTRHCHSDTALLAPLRSKRGVLRATTLFLPLGKVDCILWQNQKLISSLKQHFR